MDVDGTRRSASVAAVVVFGALGAIALAIVLDRPPPSPIRDPDAPSAIASPSPAPSAAIVVLDEAVPPPPHFPVGRYGVLVTGEDRPPHRLFLGDQEMDFRPDGTFLGYGTIDGGGLYLVLDDRIEFHREVLCRNDRQVGFYRWRRDGSSLYFTLDTLGDACGSDRIWHLTAKPWEYRGPSAGE